MLHVCLCYTPHRQVVYDYGSRRTAPNEAALYLRKGCCRSCGRAWQLQSKQTDMVVMVGGWGRSLGGDRETEIETEIDSATDRQT